MRIPLWPVLVCGLLAAVVGQTAFGFEGPPRRRQTSPVVNAAASYSVDPFEETEAVDVPARRPAYQPVQYVPSTAPGPEAYGTPEMPPGMPPNAWPAISPYSEHNLEEYYNDGGVWTYNPNDEPTTNILSAEFLIVWGVKPGNHLIGSQLSNFVPSFTPGLQNQAVVLTPVFPNQFTSNFNDIKHYGVKLRYGWENPDESGVILSGWYAAENERIVGPSTAHINPIYTPPNGNSSIFPDIQALASITFNQPGVGPNQVLYDTFFAKTYDQQFWGADIDAYVAPFFRRPSFRLQMVWGVKYLYIWESLSVRAQDSSLGYTVDQTGGINNIIDLGLPPLDTLINATTVTNLVGPQIGVRYDLGGDKFKIWGQTKVAVAANIEQARVFGSNAVDPIDRAILGQTFFDSRRSNTHVSPILDQSIYGQFPLFSFLPIVNRWRLINEANFRIGFNYLLVGEVSRPANDITYTYRNPTVNSDRTWMSLKTLSFAIDWNY